jgi:DNA-binding NtrC family response regulator
METRSFRHITGSRIIKGECAIIAANSRNLRELSDMKLFRSDLHLRLGIFSLALPPYRERREDTVDLVRLEPDWLNTQYGIMKTLDPDWLHAINVHDFPGNMRELLDCFHQAVLLSEGPRIGECLASLLESSRNKPETVDLLLAGHGDVKLSENLKESEKLSFLKAIVTCRNTREMAIRLGISQAGVSRKLKKHGLPLPKNRSELLRDQAATSGAGSLALVQVAEVLAASGKD